MSKPKIENKPRYCHAWISKATDTVLCNAMPCCGFCISPACEKAIKKEKSFTGYKQVGRNQLEK